MAFRQLPASWVIWGYGLQITQVIIIRVSSPEGSVSDGIRHSANDGWPAALLGDRLDQVPLSGPSPMTL